MVSDGHGGHSTRSQVVRGLQLLDSGPRRRGRVNKQEASEDESNSPEEAKNEIVRGVDAETGRRTQRFNTPTGGAPLGTEASRRLRR
jgi:hypothetical protein